MIYGLTKQIKLQQKYYHSFAQRGMLDRQSIIINDQYAIVGHVGWYDYSYADHRFSQQK